MRHEGLDRSAGVHQVSTYQEYEKWRKDSLARLDDTPCQAILAVDVLSIGFENHDGKIRLKRFAVFE